MKQRHVIRTIAEAVSAPKEKKKKERAAAKPQAKFDTYTSKRVADFKIYGYDGQCDKSGFGGNLGFSLLGWTCPVQSFDFYDQISYLFDPKKKTMTVPRYVKEAPVCGPCGPDVSPSMGRYVGFKRLSVLVQAYLRAYLIVFL